MKIFFLVCAICISSCVLSLPAGNPIDPLLYHKSVWLQGCDLEAASLRVGFVGDYIYNREMRLADSKPTRTIRRTRLMTNSGLVALNFCRLFDIFATFGASRFSLETPHVAFDNQTPDLRNIFVINDPVFSWSAGAKGGWQCGCFGIGVGGQYFQMRPSFGQARLEGDVTTYHAGEKIKYIDWQISGGLTYRINIANCGTAALPYFTLNFGNAHWMTSQFTVGNSTFRGLEGNRKVGYTFGLTLLGCEKWSVSAEAQFIKEKALAINTQVAF